MFFFLPLSSRIVPLKIRFLQEKACFREAPGGGGEEERKTKNKNKTKRKKEREKRKQSKKKQKKEKDENMKNGKTETMKKRFFFFRIFFKKK